MVEKICDVFGSHFTGFMEGIIKLTIFDLDFVNVEVKLEFIKYVLYMHQKSNVLESIE
jgi:hypothetical protein